MHNKQKTERMARIRTEALEKARAYKRLFESPDGKEVLDDLKRAFRDPDLHNEHAHYTHVRAGEMNVIGYIEDVINLKTEDIEV